MLAKLVGHHFDYAFAGLFGFAERPTAELRFYPSPSIRRAAD